MLPFPMAVPVMVRPVADTVGPPAAIGPKLRGMVQTA